ncbi:Leucine-rich repeat-containing protein 4B, partial [Stegodyphus mimosarum]
MFRFRIRKQSLLLLLGIVCFAHGNSTLPEVSTSIIPQIITTDACNMALVSVYESKNARQVKCTCSSVDVECGHLDIEELPKLISFPKKIVFANFKGNKISNLNSDTFYNGRDILKLDLSYNRIDFISVDAFKAFKSLITLDLSHNRIWNLPAKAFQGMTQLKKLDLSFNDVINVFPDIFIPLTELRELILESNPIQELEPKQFLALHKLEALDLKATRLSVIPDHLFIFTPKLKILSLAENLLTEIPTEALKVLDHLRVLDLSGNRVDIIKEEAFMGLRGLTTLYLERMSELRKIEKYAFGDMIHLQELQCSYNFLLSEIDERAFIKKSTNEKVPLVQLFLRQNKLETLSKDLLHWNDAVELHLLDNPMHCDCNIEWMVHQKLKNDFQRHVRCASPSHLENIALKDLKDYELTCGLTISEVILIACSVVIALLILILIVAFLVWKRSYAGYRKPYFGYGQKHNDADIDYNAEDGM